MIEILRNDRVEKSANIGKKSMKEIRRKTDIFHIRFFLGGGKKRMKKAD